MQWFVREGDVVEEFGRVCEVQSDKATIEITSPYAGVVKALRHAAGEVVQVGDVLADIHCSSSENDEYADATAAAVPQHGAGGPPATAAAAASAAGQADRVLTSPAVRALSREMGIDLTTVSGTGPGGRVTKGDVLAFAGSLAAAAATPAAAVAAAATASSAVSKLSAALTPRTFVFPTKEEASVAASVPPAALPAAAGAPLPPLVIPLRGYRRAMLRSMTAAAAVPHFHLSDDVRVDAVVALREALKGAAALRGAKLTYLPFFVKAAAIALEEFPALNSSLAPDGASLLQHRQANIGVAVSTRLGLVVPNIKDVGARSVADVARELARLSAAAAANQLRPEDVSGGTFTLSNIGSVGGTYAAPLVNLPEVRHRAAPPRCRAPPLACPAAAALRALRMRRSAARAGGPQHPRARTFRFIRR